MSFDIMKIFDVIILFLGAYIAYGAVRLKANNIPQTFIPMENQRRCKDVEGLSKTLFLPACLFALASLLYGVFSFLTDFQLLPESVSNQASIISMALMILFIVAWVYFSYVLRKAVEKYCS